MGGLKSRDMRGPMGSSRARNDLTNPRPRVRTAVFAVLAILASVVVASVGVASPASAQDIVSQVQWGKDSGEQWRFASSNTVGDLGAGVAAPNFDDSAWPQVNFRYFANPGSGSVNYFRKDFQIDELFRVVGIEVEFQYDDAAVLYLNGTEVYRTIRENLPSLAEVPLGGDIPADQNVPHGGAEDQYIQIPGMNTCQVGTPAPCGNQAVEVAAIPFELLVEGSNTWTISLWNRTGSTDVSADHEFRLLIDRDASALEIEPVPSQASQLADSISLQMVGDSPNPGPITWSETGLPDGLTLNASSGLITGAPTAEGNFTVVVTANDGVRPAEVSFTWSVVNAPPVIENPGPQQTPSFTPSTLTINATDPDGGPLTFAATGLPPGMEINTSTGAITGSSSAENAYSVEITVTDDENAAEMVSFSWQIAEPPITINNPGNLTSVFGVATALQLVANDPAGGNVVLSVEGLPTGMSFNAANKLVSGTPTEIGNFSVIVSGTGPSGQSIISFEWDIPNLPPAIAAIPDQVALEGLAVSVALNATDPDGGSVTYAVSNVPSGLLVDSITGVITGVPTGPGNYNVVVTVTDDEGDDSTTTFRWRLFGAIAQPIVINEFVASNDASLMDEDGSTPDWIELRSLAPVELNLDGWVLQDGAASWTFPATPIPAGGYVIVFASDKDRAVAGSELHTNFKLSKESDSLALIDADGFVIDEFAAEDLPQQFTDVSYGRASDDSIFYLEATTPGGPNSAAGSNYAPVLRPFTDRLYNVGEPVNESIDAFDPDGGPMSYALAPLPPGVGIDITTGIITGMATTAGVYTSEIEVIDLEGKRQTQSTRWIFIDAPAGPTRLALNEYNAVAPTSLLVGGEDPAFGLVEGNGGDWFEFVVVQDRLDLRGWSIELWDRDHNDDLLELSSTLVFANTPDMASLPSGTILTISQDRVDDLSLDPGADDWHINLQSNDLDEGAHFTADSQENFNSSRANQAVILRNAAGQIESPAVGETELWDELVGGVGSGEVMSLCIDPTGAAIDGVTSYLDNGEFSSYGEPNSCIFVNDPLDPDDDVQFDQSFAALRDGAVLVAASVASACVAGDGDLVISLSNSSGANVQFSITVTGAGTTLRTVASGASLDTTIAGIADGPAEVAVAANGVPVLNETVQVDCDVAQPPRFTGEVEHIVSCLAGNGRVDTIIVNPGPQAAAYRLEFQGLTPRQNTVEALDWWRMPITGRADGTYTALVTRNGTEVSNTTVTVACDTAPPQIDEPEVNVVNACRQGNGYVLFEFVNPTPAVRGWVIVFEGVGNRSTSAAGYGQSVRSVTGRQDGTYNVLIRADGVTLTTFTVTIACNE